MLYVAYGSNINLEQMDFRCPHSRIVGKGKVLNHRLVFNFHADIIPADGVDTPVLIWKIDDRDWNNLDRYEGCPRYYVKKIVDVENEKGETYRALAYVMADNMRGFDLPSLDYFRTIKIGYIENNMDLNELWKGIQYTYGKVQEEEEIYGV